MWDGHFLLVALLLLCISEKLDTDALAKAEEGFPKRPLVEKR